MVGILFPHSAKAARPRIDTETSRDDEGGEYITTFRGAKVYTQFEKNPRLEIKTIKSPSEQRTVYEVLSAGFFNEDQPFVTISVDNMAKCFALPKSLCDWVRSAVLHRLTTGDNFFPCKVEFSFINGRYDANYALP